MDKLPLELKQRICSFLHASPKLLKPIRLASTEFALAAAPYLLPRIFLFKHPTSCAEVKEIVEHATFSKHVTTLVVDLSTLRSQATLQDWIDDHDHLQNAYPDWWDFKPADIDYDEDGDPLLYTSRSRAKWMNACKAFDRAAKKVTKTLKISQEQYWKAHQSLAEALSSNEFRRCFSETIQLAFKMCPNLSNIVIAPPQPYDPAVAKRYHMFNAIHPSQGSWVDHTMHDPSYFKLVDLMQAVGHHKDGLHSLTIIDLPFMCADHFTVEHLSSLKRLKHVRIGYSRLDQNPKLDFGFGIEGVIRAATSLETFWTTMPPFGVPHFNADGILHAINSKALRDILLDNVSVTEDALVDFLLRHAGSLQKLDLNAALITGTWSSVFRRVSCRMKVLKRAQLLSLEEKNISGDITFSPSWCSEAEGFILQGGQLSEPIAYDEDDEDQYEEATGTPCRNYDVPEDGLWEEYDGNVNTCF